MLEITTNTAYTAQWAVRLLDGSLKTGLVAGDFTATLKRRTTGAFSSATETVTISECGSGVYKAVFTPTGSGYTYWLQVVEGTFALSQQLTHDFIEITSSSTSASANDAFASTDDAQSKLGLSLSASTIPTTAQLLIWLAMRAADVEAVMHAHSYLYTVASGNKPLSGDTSEKGRVMTMLTREANATGAAADAMFAWEAIHQGDTNQRAAQLWNDYQLSLTRIDNYLMSQRTSTTARHTITTGAAAETWQVNTDF